MLIGMADWASASGNDTLWDWLQDLSADQNYRLGNREYHADDHAVGQVYHALEVERGVPFTVALGPTQEQFDFILDNRSNISLDHRVPGPLEYREMGYRPACQLRWCWCDAIFMAPPTWLGLASSSGDSKYIDFADEEFWATHDYLYRELPDFAPGGGLYLRDSRFFEPDETGKLIFWGRGNGWVYAGLTSILELLPANHPSRERYEALFIQMSRALLVAQVPTGPHAGFWSPSLLAYEEHPFPESSSTGFFVSGLAFGVRTGRLNSPEYLLAAQRGWTALLSAQLPDGRIGWTQQIGAEPDSVKETDTQLYSTGAFLKAAAEMLKLACTGELVTGEDTPSTGPGTLPATQGTPAFDKPPEAGMAPPCGRQSMCGPASRARARRRVRRRAD